MTNNIINNLNTRIIELQNNPIDSSSTFISLIESYSNLLSIKYSLDYFKVFYKVSHHLDDVFEVDFSDNIYRVCMAENIENSMISSELIYLEKYYQNIEFT